MRDVVRPPAKSGGRHTTTTSHTLMRHVVKKPKVETRKHSAAHSLTLTKPTMSEVVVGKSAKRLDPKRLNRAKRVPQSQLISHFSPVTSNVLAPQLTPAMPVATPAPLASPQPKSQPKTTADLLEHALKHATSHEQPAPKHRPSRRKRTAGMAGAVAVVALLIGLIINQNTLNLRLQMASTQAGFDVSLPEYQPAGYSLTQLNASSGIVSGHFRSHSDNRSYTITEKKSNWDSRALRDTFVAPTGEYQTVEQGGRTIFLYGKGSATWINGGIWYVIQSHDSLSQRQLLELATSL